MHIKQVIIQGFRSYRDQTVIEPFSPKHNVVVGRNGSGKSNFFYAIQFVLSDEFNNMRQEDRQTLMHEGTGNRIVSCYVEVIFDNEDRRLPIEKDEVSLRRVVGSKKDQYFLDKKCVTKSDVMNLFESAGFSRSNPYYIVKQGKINQLAVMKDQQRLNLLREVAGTRVYDERKAESHNILVETESKRNKINEFLDYIDERLETLETEKEELKNYQKLDKERRSVEYTIHDKDKKQIQKELDKLENERPDEEIRQELTQDIEQSSNEIKRLEDLLTGQNQDIKRSKEEKGQLDSEHRDFVESKTKLELQIKDLEEGIVDDETNLKKSRTELTKLEKTIETKQNELDEILPLFDQKLAKEKETETKLKSSEQRRTDLFSKQGRTSQFKSREERDRWLNKQVKDVKALISVREKQIANTELGTGKIRERLNELEHIIQEQQEGIENKRSQMEQIEREATEKKRKRDQLTDKRKEFWKMESGIEAEITKYKENWKRASRELNSTLGKARAQGLESVRRIQEEKQLDGVYGPVIENFEVADQFFTPVEITAGNRLFNILVDKVETGTQLLRYMNQMKLPGEISMMPLNKLKYKTPAYPETKDALPMIRKATYNEKFEPAMQLIFGKTLICRNMDAASQFSKECSLDCITLHGDQFHRKGTISGGHIEKRTSRLSFQKEKVENLNMLHDKEEEHQKVKQELSQLDAQITDVLAELEKKKTKQAQNQTAFERLKQDLKNNQKEKSQCELSIGPQESQLRDSKAELETLKSQLSSYQDELGTELLSQLSSQDQNEVQELNEEIKSMKDALKNLIKERTSLESKKQTLEQQLHNNFFKKREELKNSLENAETGEKQHRLDRKRTDLISLEEKIKKSSDAIKGINKNITEMEREVKETVTLKNRELDTKKKKEEKLEEDANRMERLAGKKSALLKKKDECIQKVRELGCLPGDIDAYARLTVKQLWRRLQETNEQLKGYSHVNKKALDQFVSFTEQKEKLMNRKSEIDAGHESIVDLMEVLEQRKDEAIRHTFKQVSSHFADIFKTLVPGGKASLTLMKDRTQDGDEDSSSQPSSEPSSSQGKIYDNYIGVSIKVSFSGTKAETLEMNQLSGGQKTLVAMTLIFAIQRCDPAPFYLFDEIDQALDPVYRSSVAGMIHELSDNAQFITTTFRPELLESADKFYGVTFKNKVSHINLITKEEAKDFIIDDEAEQPTGPEE